MNFESAANDVSILFILYQGGPTDASLSIGHGSNGIIELLQKSFTNLDLEYELNFPINVEKRDVFDIPNYHYRDDGLKVWNAVMSYVEDIIKEFYYDERDVKEDHELQKWVAEINWYELNKNISYKKVHEYKW